jgi:photosystem II stability/assembly factor-like uncharacterized protein
MTKKNSPLPGLGSVETLVLMEGLFVGMIVPGASLAASPTIDCGDFSAAITDCADVSPRTDSFPIEDDLQQSVSGRMLSLTVSADGTRLYVGGSSGVWRSDDAGATWHQLTRPQPTSANNEVPGALSVPNVFDVVVSPTNMSIVLAATAYDTRVPSKSKNGIYYSDSGGDSWRLAHQFRCPGSVGAGPVGQIVFAPDDPRLVYAAGGCSIAISSDGGWTWVATPIVDKSTSERGTVWHVAVAPPKDSKRRVYAAGPDQIWYSEDGGSTWSKDLDAQIPDMGKFGGIKWGTVGGFPDGGAGNSAQVLAVEPDHPENVYVAVTNISNGPAYYFAGVDNGENCEIRVRCGGAAVWFGDYSSFFQRGRSGDWRRLPSPPAYQGVSTPSGRVYIVATKPHNTSGSYLLFLADGSHVHVSQGRPDQSAAWHRLDGRNASQSKRDNQLSNKLFVHVDPYAIAISENFEITLKPSNLPPPFNQNSELDLFVGGMIWMANDGGVYRSTDGGVTWRLASGLSTLQPQSRIAGIALPGRPPALYFGVPDNDNFFSTDGGGTWKDHPIDCGDCNPWFSDPAQPDRVFGSPRASIVIDMRNTGDYPDGTKVHIPPFPTGFVHSFEQGVFSSKQGYRPIILTLKGEAPLADGDYVLIRQITPEKRVLLRVTDISQITTASDWDTIPVQQGPDLVGEMNGVYVVQAAGGHSSPVFYVGDPGVSDGLWKWTTGMRVWQRIVGPSSSARKARRFFADPYDPNLIYVIDENAIKRSEDGGQTWQVDVNLDRGVTENGAFAHAIQRVPGWVGEAAVISDMDFDREERGTRFAVGSAGVFFTLDGENWDRLLSTEALPGHPVGAYFDRIGGPFNRALYVAMNGRGILRLSPIPVPVTSFTGKAHGVGLGARGGIGIVGRFTFDGDLDLSKPGATVTITDLFNEVGGAEVVAPLPQTLFADPRNNANVGIFKTPVGTFPIAKVTIGATGGGRFTLRVDVAKATIVPPSLCPTTDLRTSFTINDGVHPPVVVTTTQPWLCFGAGNKYLKSPPP